MPDEYELRERKAGPVRFSSDISLGQIIQAVVAGAGFLWIASTYANKVTTTEAGLATMQASMSKQEASLAGQLASQKVDFAAQISSVSLNMNDQFKTLQLAIANMPDMRAEVTQLGKRADGFDNRLGAQSDRMSKFETVLFQLGARVDAADAKPTPGRH